MMLAKNGGQSGRRKAAVRAGLLAVSAATAAGLAAPQAAKGDITVSNPFSNFANPNLNSYALATPSGIGYSGGGTSFETTNNNGNEAVSGFYQTPQTVSSFDVSFTLTASGGADGGAFIIDGNSNALTYLGNGGGSGGYDGGTNDANTLAFQWEFYNAPSSGASVNGTNGTSAWTSATDQGSGYPTIKNGDPIQFNLAYYGTTMTMTAVDTTAHTGYTQIYTGITMPTLSGTSTAYVGFSGGTGGSTSTQTISNFVMVSNKSYAPISITSGSYNQKGIVPDGGSLSSINATQDNGTKLGGDTWYEVGFDTSAPTTGIPHAGATFTSQADTHHVFTMAPSYSSNDVILLSGSSTGDGPSTATITFTNNAQPYNALSFLTASGNGPNVVGLTINYADSHAATTGLQFLSPDWFSGSPAAYTANGRYSGNFDNVNSGNPSLYAEDVTLPDNTDPIASVTLTFLGGNRSPTGNVFIFGVSGEAGAAGPLITYTGAQSIAKSAGVWDNGITPNFNGVSGSIATAVTFANGDQVTFDDTAAGPHTVNAASSGMQVSNWIVNTSTGYIFTGYGLAGYNGSGGLSLNNTGTVVLAQSTSNTFTSATSINAGLLQMNSGSGLASTTINVAAGAGLNVSSGATLSASAAASTLTLNDSGTVNYYNPTLNLALLAGASTGVLNLNGTALTIASTSYAGTIGGTSGSVLFTGSGNFGGTIIDGTSSPIAVTINSSTGTVIFSGSNTYSGGTYLAGGALEVSSAASLGTGPVVLEGGALGASSADVNLPNNISGGALIVPAGSNTLELSGTGSTFTGPVVIQATTGGTSGATLAMDNPSALGHATSIIVGGPGAAFEVNSSASNTGQGMTVQITGGGVVTTGTYAGPSGSLRGGDNINAVWAGNVTVVGPSYIESGAYNTGQATLTLTGSINGSGPVIFTGSPNDINGGGTIILAPSAGNSNTYTGETQLIPEANPNTFNNNNNLAGTTLLQLGANNAISTVSGLNIIAGTAVQNVNFDMAGYNQSIAYLSGGAQTGYAIINSGASQSILTINSGTNTISSSCSTAITGNILIVKAGNGNQTLSGNNSYYGGTNISGGTLTIPVSAALGSGPVRLAGGALSLQTSSLSGPPTLSGLSNFTLGGSPQATISSGVVTLNPTNGSLGYAYNPTTVAVSDTNGFTTSFIYNPLPEGAGYTQGGMAINIVNSQVSGSGPFGDGVNPGGSAAGWKGIAIGFNVLYQATDAGSEGTYTALLQNGSFTKAQSNLYDIDPYPNGQAPITVILSYSNGTLTETLEAASHDWDGTASPTSITFTYSNVDLAADLGSTTGSAQAYIGFTGANLIGSSTPNYYWEQQQISNFNYTNGGLIPVPVTNPVIGVPNTTSSIQIGTSNSALNSNNEMLQGGMNIGSGAVVHVTQAAGSTGIPVLTISSLSIAGSGSSYSGQLDIANGDLILPGASLATVSAMVKQGYANGAWTGNGITSSLAAGDTSHLSAVGVIINDSGANNGNSTGTALYGNGGGNGSLSTAFDGTATNDGDILVKYTYYGDCNLDGAVDGTDYSIVDATYLAENFSSGAATNPISGWYNGDFNYDGVVDGSDYTLMDNAFNQQGPSFGVNPSALLATSTAQISGTGSAVPEPAALSLLAIGATAMLGRRRRRH